MHCSKCGREISDQARFCNYCGSRTNVALQQAEPQPEPVKKKSGAARWILSTLLIVLVAAVAKQFAANMISKSNNASDYQQELQTVSVVDPDIDAAMDSCINGALYQDGYLRYGFAKVYMPGYTLVPGEGNVSDYLLSPDATSLFNATRQFEAGGVSYEKSDAQGILDSFQLDNTVANVSMLDFRKYEINGYPVMRYIASAQVSGRNEYIGELIILSDVNASTSIRFVMETLAEAEDGYGEINKVFDTLQLSPDFKVKAEDTNVSGFNRIAVKDGASHATQEFAVNTSTSVPEETIAGTQWSEAEIQAAMDSCNNGAIYEKGALRYGLAKLDMPGYKLDRGLEDISVHRLYTAGGALHISTGQYLLAPSFEECTTEDLVELLWYRPESNGFEKYYVNGFPVIRCYYYDESYSLFIGHLIIYPYKTSDTAIGFSMTADAAAGYQYTDIYEVFDTLQVSPEYMVTGTNVGDFGSKLITVK